MGGDSEEEEEEEEYADDDDESEEVCSDTDWIDTFLISPNNAG